MIDQTALRLAGGKAAVVLVPSYGAAALTDKMVRVVPTLAAASFFAADIGPTPAQLRRRVDEDDATDTLSNDLPAQGGGP